MDVDRTHMPVPGPLKTAIDFPTVTQTTLPGGLKLVVAQRPDAGITDMSVRFARNPLAATDAETATAQRAFALLTASEPENGAEPIRQRLARNGIALRTDVGEWGASVTWSAANPEVGLSLELVGEMLAEARFPQAAVDRANADASRRVAGREVSSDRLLRHALLGESNPRGRPSPADSVDIPREALLAYRDTVMAQENATLYIVGGVDPARARDLAMRNFGTPRNGAATPPHPTPIPAAAPQSARIILVDAPGAQQSSISVGKVIAPFSAENAAVEALVAGVLADHGPGRFNRNLRQSKGWSYAFGGGIEDSPAGQRVFSASGTVQADKTAESLLALQDELSGIVGANPISQAELDAQRRLLIGRTVQEFTGNAAFLQAFVTAGTYGLPYDHAASVDRRLAAVMIEDAREVAGTLFDGPATFVVIGDLASIEPVIRAQAFAPVEIWDSAGRKVR
ncbi:MAG: insulinase family protein [Pseudomonadota bacterium]|jgi:zinc protease|nr:insulinase family protein [Pseudomonadota bacterium]